MLLPHPAALWVMCSVFNKVDNRKAKRCSPSCKALKKCTLTRWVGGLICSNKVLKRWTAHKHLHPHRKPTSALTDDSKTEKKRSILTQPGTSPGHYCTVLTSSFDWSLTPKDESVSQLSKPRKVCEMFRLFLHTQALDILITPHLHTAKKKKKKKPHTHRDKTQVSYPWCIASWTFPLALFSINRRQLAAECSALSQTESCVGPDRLVFLSSFSDFPRGEMWISHVGKLLFASLGCIASRPRQREPKVLYLLHTT